MVDIGIIIVSHNKPNYIWDAISSVKNQTHENWEAILIDSGFLYDLGEFENITDPRFTIIRSDETPEIKSNRIMASWCFNKLLKDIKWPLIMYLCDDDYLYNTAFEKFVNLYKETKSDCMYSSQHIGRIENGKTNIIGTRWADCIRGTKSGGHRLDCQVDYLQFCHSREALNKYIEIYGEEVHPEAKEHYWHADGIFMERMGSLFPVYPIKDILSINRRTPESVNIK